MPKGLAPSVSLVVLNWNGRRHLDSCLTSLLDLDYASGRLEVILCDNGSTDGSADHVRARFPRVRVVALAHNHGFAEGNDLAVAEATGEWVAFLNNDMWVERSWLSDMIGVLGDHPQAVCLASRIKNWDGSAIDFIGGGVNYQGHGFQLAFQETDSARDVERRVLFACGGAMLVRRDVFNEVGGFDPDYFAFFEDVDLGWRLNLLGKEVWYTPRATAYHRHHGTANKLPHHKLHMLFERNALFTVYKCFSDETLDRVLPTALLLLNERGLTIASPDRNQFRLTPARPVEPAASLPGARREPLPARARRVLRREGVGRAVAKAGRLLRHYTRQATTAAAARLGPNLLQSRGSLVVWPSVAASHWVAASEFAHALERFQVKRCWLQQRRQVSDAELVRLFEDPFFANYPDARYVQFYRWLTRVQGLDRLFESPHD